MSITMSQTIDRPSTTDDPRTGDRATHTPGGHRGTPRLLTGSDVGLADHLATHGALFIPAGNDMGWSTQIWEAVSASGIRGRGGAGFPSALKWNAVRQGRRQPMVVVNAMEGEPASRKDRTLLAHAPHLMLDGAEVAAAVVGACEVVVCVAHDNPVAAASVERAVIERESSGLARFRISVLRPPGRYVSGEESALVAWLDHQRALPQLRLDKSVPLQVSRRPVVLHNAETLAQIALIARHGPEWFRRQGTPEAPGSTLVTVGGAVRSPGVFEVELGTPVIDILHGAGLDAELSGLLLGGYGGAWLHPSKVATPFSPGPLTEAGATLGVGIIIALPVGVCGLAETARIARYMAGESAGQCGPCVYGLPDLATDLERLSAGRADGQILDRIRNRAAAIEGRGACRHPDGVVRLVRSALAVFVDDAKAHANRRPCPGHAGHSLMTFPDTTEAASWAS
ncbi:MAG TPA: NADH-ubiquinone oxidoreductase-F iron-sulfur binding region domain-containing protein [Acidimicrobiales bacterium]|nr:NADH-ubiquinone oxidoreductase-F iron-sulfur binding region domain-containing protein [Acidimicrobiales bacterium]